MIFSFTVTSLALAECVVEIFPSRPTVVVTGGTVQFTAVTQGEGCNAPNYTWEIVASADCTAPSEIDENGLYTASEACNCDCNLDVIKVTDTANGNITAEAIATIAGCGNFEVTITPNVVNLEPGSMQTFSAHTVYCGTLTGTYTWDVQGGTADTTTGDSINYTAGDISGTYTITVTDTANGGRQATATVLISSHPCFFRHTESVFRSRWILLPAVVILEEGCGHCDFGRLELFPELSPLSVIPLLNFKYDRRGFIFQYILVMPSIVTGIGFNGSSEAVTVSMQNCGCTPTTFDIKMLPII